jgi:aspartyl-tRNA(Asn)/glutamyl-tRNA(Gln) amidotransferase subunit C
MSLTTLDVKKIAHLARLTMSDEDLAIYTPQLTHILDWVAQMNTVDTDQLAPLTNPLNSSQRLRADEVTETDQRDAFQAIAPLVADGLYLVPKVIEG